MEILPLDNSPVASNQPHGVNKKFRLLIGLVFGVLILVGVAVVSVAIYLLPFTDGFVRSITTVAPYPVVLVNLHSITFKDFYKEYDALQNFYLANETPAEEQLSTAEMSTNILDTMINHAAVAQLAKQYSIELDAAKLEENLQAAYTQSGSEEAFFSQIQTMFGWSREDFLTHAMKPLVLSSQVEEKVLADADLQVEAKTKIDGALSRLNNKEDFAIVAGEVSEDPSVDAGGDIGHLTIDQIPAEWADFVTATELNVPSEIIDLGQVYSIIMVTEKVGTDPNTQYNLKIIIVYKKGLDDVVQSYLDSSKVWRLVKN